MAPIVIGGIGARTIGRRPICIIAVVVVVVALLLFMFIMLIAGFTTQIVSLRCFNVVVLWRIIITIAAWRSGVASVVALRCFIMVRAPWRPCNAPIMALVFIVMAPWRPFMSMVMRAMAMMVVTTTIL